MSMKKKNSDLDDIVREKLSKLNPEYNSASWNSLKAKLDGAQPGGRPSINNEQFDELIHDKVQGFEPSFQPSHWATLAARLEAQQTLNRTILRAKIFEFSAALLLLLFCSQWPAGDGVWQDALPVYEKSVPKASPHPANSLPKTNPDQPRASAEQSKDNIPTTTVSGKEKLEEISITPLAFGYMPRSFSLPSNHSGTQLSQQNNVLPLPSASGDMVESSQTANMSLRKELHKTLPINAYDVKPAEPTAAIGTIDLGSLDYGDFNTSDIPAIKPPQKKRFLRVGMMGAPDYNRIITPPTIIDKNTAAISVDRYTLGYSGGITLGFEAKKWEVETGLIYAAKHYTPLQILFVEGSVRDGFYGESLQHFELNTFYVPLNFRYNFYLKDKWRMYTLIGAAWHVVFQADYYVNFQPTSKLMPAPALEGTGSGHTTGIDQQNFVNGWFEGGSLLENSYFSVNAGIGIERYMTNRWSIFAQPTYQHSLLYLNPGLGPFKDRIHTMSILMGVKVRL